MLSLTSNVVLSISANLLSGGFLYQAGMISAACTEAAGWALMPTTAAHKATDVVLQHQDGRVAILAHSASTGNLQAAGTSIGSWVPMGKALIWEQTMLHLLGKDSTAAGRVQWGNAHKTQVRKDWAAAQILILWLAAEHEYTLLSSWLAAEATHLQAAPKPAARKPAARKTAVTV
jgi:hypothetical protein